MDDTSIMSTVEYILSLRTVRAVLVFAGASALAAVLRRMLRSRLTKNILNLDEERAARNKTLLGVSSKAVMVLIYFFALLYIMQILFDVQPSSVIAATGIVSVAFGFGAQSIVKDSITGFFILAENQYSVGDYVTIGTFMGRVISISLRTTRLQSFDGDILIVPNGNIDRVINHSRSDRSVFAEIAVSYDTDIDRAVRVLGEACEKLFAADDNLLSKPEILGVSRLGESGVYIKTMISCKADTQYASERAFLKTAYDALRDAGISIPYNHIVIKKE